MIIIFKPGATEKEIGQTASMLKLQGRNPHVVQVNSQPVIEVEGRGDKQGMLDFFRSERFVDDVVIMRNRAADMSESEISGIILKPNIPEDEISRLLNMITKMKLSAQVVKHQGVVMIVPGKDEHFDLLKTLPYIEKVMPANKRYKLASRDYCATDSIVKIGGQKIGGGHFQIIAGPCAVESLEQMRQTANDIIPAGIKIIRGGAFKPRTSPYDFQGLKEKGLEILQQIKEEFGVAIVTEIVNESHLDKLAKVADCIQIGARNSQNYHLLEAVASAGKPIMLKRGMASTIEEWLSAAEYLLVNGCMDVILCERGIKTFETATRNTLDISAVAIAKQETHLPVVVDPSHAAGRTDLLLPLSRAAIAAGADGILLETHPDPGRAVSDAAQQIPSAMFADFVNSLKPLIKVMSPK